LWPIGHEQNYFSEPPPLFQNQFSLVFYWLINYLIDFYYDIENHMLIFSHSKSFLISSHGLWPSYWMLRIFIIQIYWFVNQTYINTICCVLYLFIFCIFSIHLIVFVVQIFYVRVEFVSHIIFTCCNKVLLHSSTILH
jgi:hypothetical protein